MPKRILILIALTTCLGVAKNAAAQNESPICGVKHLDLCFKDLGYDQAGIWTSPLRLQAGDAVWVVPFAGATAAALHYDVDAQQQLGIDRNRIDTSRSISRFGSPHATVAAGVGLYGLGIVSKNEKLQETGRLGTEAVINAVIVVEGFKLATNRERPEDGVGTGRFWPHGTSQYSLDGSFPSGHAAGFVGFGPRGRR